METVTTKRFFNTKTYRRAGILAGSSVFLLFLLGGLVRVTGSGMGCPDWPRCFGLLVPPTCACQLPDNYQEIYLQKRKAKVIRFANALERIGLEAKANTLRNDKSIYTPEYFNATKAWIEYINRIFGVIAGLLTLAFFILAIKFAKSRLAFVFSLASLIFLVLNAWLGSIVVATNLLPGIVSIHFMLSFLCIFSIMLALHAHKPFTNKQSNSPRWVWLVLFFITIFEVFLGTLARERVEFLQILNTLTQENGFLNMESMGSLFAVHRYLPGVIVLLTAYLYVMAKYRTADSAKSNYLVIGIISLIQISLGAVNIVMVLPPWCQVSHIILGSFLPIITFYYLLQTKTSNFSNA